MNTETLPEDDNRDLPDLTQAEPVPENTLLPPRAKTKRVSRKKSSSTAPSSERSEPAMTDPGWSDFVRSQFTDEEVDDDGNPFVHGLRRVARLLLGPVLASFPRTVQAPSFVGGLEGATLLQPAVVEYHLKILMCRLEQGMSQAYPVEFADVADVYFGNTDPEFQRHASATAATRAEARAYRKALQLQKVIAAEEKTLVPLGEASTNGFITPTQISFLQVLCERNDINLIAFISMGKNQYGRVEDVPYGAALKMVEYLSDLQNDPSKVPAAIKGYDPNWRAR